CYAHDIWMYYDNYWLTPDSSLYTSTSAPYRATDMAYGLTGNHGSDNTSFLTMTPDWVIGSGTLDGSGSTMTATLSGSTMNTPTGTAGGSGYTPSTNLYWYAFQGSSGCTVQGHYGNYESTNSGPNN